MSKLESVDQQRLLIRPRVVRGWTEVLLISALGIAFTTIWAVKVGKDVGWDQRNYHYYSVHAWLTGRVDYHIQPAGQQSWFNPLVYVPHYWVINHFRPIVAGGLFGSWIGLNFVFIYLLVRLVLPMHGSFWGKPVAFLCAAVGFSDPFFLQFIGSTDVDNLVSLPVLASLCALCWATGSDIPDRARDRAYAFSGILLGAASGLKLTFFVYAVAMGLTLLVLWSILRLNLRRFTYFSVGGVLGFALFAGAWSWMLWRQYRNPFFPYWNRYFRSSWALGSNFRDMRFPPLSLEAAITYPFSWFVGNAPTSEDPFRDARYALLCIFVVVIALALIGGWMARRWERGEAKRANLLVARQHWWMLLTFSVISYLLWIKTFGIQRYLIPLGLISGLLLWLALDWLVSGKGAKLMTFFFLAVFCIIWTRIDVTYWRLPYGSDWFGIELAPEVQQPGTLFVIVGGEPLSYVIPFLPDSVRAVRLSGVMIPDAETGMVHRAREVISQHTGPIRSLAALPVTEADYLPLSRFGLAVDQGACVQFHSVADQFTSCRVSRASDASMTPRP